MSPRPMLRIAVGLVILAIVILAIEDSADETLDILGEMDPRQQEFLVFEPAVYLVGEGRKDD